MDFYYSPAIQVLSRMVESVQVDISAYLDLIREFSEEGIYQKPSELGFRINVLKT